MARVVLQHIEKTYPNGVRAVREVNLAVADGECFVLVGASGCGKTTLLRLIAGLEIPTRGEVLIGDRRMNDVGPIDRDVAMVFQNSALYPHMSVAQNLAFGLKMRGVHKPDIARRVREAANLLSIGHLIERRPAELSGGERGRVSIGRAIVRSANVFLFDEPLSDLDPLLRSQMRVEFARLRAKLGMTIIYVTHDQGEAMTLGDRIGVMNNGHILQIDTPANVYQRPANVFVATFVGNPGMNTFDGQIRDGVFHSSNPNANSEPGFVIEVDAAVGAAIGDGDVTLGIRPHDLRTDEGGRPLATVMVDLVEQLGHEMLAHFSLAGERRTVRLAAEASLRPGANLRLSYRPEAMHWFSRDDGRRLN